MLRTLAAHALFLGLLKLVLLEPALQQRDGGAEVVVQGHEQVDVVEVFLAAEARKWYEKAAAQGNEQAKKKLGQ